MVVERSRNYKGEYFMTKRNSFIESTKETTEGFSHLLCNTVQCTGTE